MIKVLRNFFTDTECDDIVAEVKSRQNSWKFYKDIYVLGNSFFRHLLANEMDVNKAWNDYNTILDNDSIAHELLRKRLSNIYGDVRFLSGFAKPGFQIITQETPRIWHYDDEKIRYPYDKLFFEYRNFDYFDDAYTLTVMLTNGNFTYEYYPQTYSRYKNNATYYCRKHHGLLGDECECDLADPIKLVYKKGDLVFTKNRYLHRVGSSIYSNDERITLQGHGVSRKKVLYLYW